ncbi:MAG: 30S ribosomal protein S20 [Patescibacteria group bacterium]|nr:30S ribosomal protein S20 [Patescibacteria group bacterium]
MPITKSAIKKARKDKKREKENLKYISLYKRIFDEIKRKVKKGESNISNLIKKYYSIIDKSVKKNIIHKNKGNRLKSKVRKILTK